MTTYSSKSEAGFFDSRVHTPEQIPSDAIKISLELYNELLNGTSTGQVIDFSVEPPVLKDQEKNWPSAAQLSASIDDKVASIYANWARFQTEHQAREAAAVAFKDAGYEGDAGIWVKSYAVPAGLTNADAADQIIAQAEAQRLAIARLAELRMLKLGLAALSDDERYERYEEIMADIADVVSSVEGA